MSFEEELEEIDRQEWLSLFDDKQIMQITRVFLDWLYDLPDDYIPCLLYTSPSPRDRTRSRMPSSA